MCSFHTPGHKGRKDFFSDIIFPEFDLTELPGLDMLHVPKGVILEAQKKAAEVFGADESFYMVNGGTTGNHALFLYQAAAGNGGKIAIGRCSHRSVAAAMVISGIKPQYIPSIVHPDFNLPLGINTEQVLEIMDEVEAIHLTYPSYYGSTVDLQKIIGYRDIYHKEKSIFVDQAHGSHYSGDLFPPSALELGADAVLHSTHKTLGSLTQTAMLHIQGKRINRGILKHSLELLQSSSPSYLFLASLEKATEQVNKVEIWQEVYGKGKNLRDRFDGAIRILSCRDEGSYGIKNVDWSKILINVSSLEIDAPEAVDILRKKYTIEPELWDHDNILFMLGIGNRPRDIDLLEKGIEYLVKKHKNNKLKRSSQEQSFRPEELYQTLPPIRLTPREAWLVKRRLVDIKDSAGCVSVETISPYPPGIPLIAAGEELTSEIVNYLDNAKCGWQGWEFSEQKKIWIADV